MQQNVKQSQAVCWWAWRLLRGLPCASIVSAPQTARLGKPKMKRVGGRATAVFVLLCWWHARPYGRLWLGGLVGNKVHHLP